MSSPQADPTDEDSDVLEQVAHLLGVDDATDQAAMTQALAALYVTPDAHHSAVLPKVTASAIAKGRRMLAWKR